MSGILLTGARLVLPDRVLERGAVRVADGRVADAGPSLEPRPGEEVVDLAGRALVPGLVDVHVHGGGGHAFQDGDPDAVRGAAAFHRERGTTTLLAGLVTAPLPDLVAAVAKLREAVAEGVVAGVHLEGPFLAAARCGAHDPALLQPPSAGALDALLVPGVVRMVTLAPELDGGLDAVRRVVAAGAVAAVGHTDAGYATALAAVDAGATVATHLFNAMPPLHHREPGAVLALLDDPRVTLEVVADGHHLHPAVVRHVLNTGRAALVSDAIPATGVPDGDHVLGGQAVRVSGGAARLVGSDVLAGSVATAADCLKRVLDGGADLHAAVTAATLTPARALGLHDVGAIAPGLRADLVVLDGRHRVERVLAGGRWLRR